MNAENMRDILSATALTTTMSETPETQELFTPYGAAIDPLINVEEGVPLDVDRTDYPHERSCG